MKVQQIKIGDLKPYSRNARTHSPKQVEEIARSIKVFGFTNPVLIDQNNMIIAGHGRVMAAKELGMEEVPTLCIDYLSDAEKRAYILADNKLAEKAGWDKEILAIELQELMVIEDDFDITLTGFETPEIDLILELDSDNVDEEIDLPMEAPKVCQKGDLWQLGEHKLYIGDSLFEESYRKLLGDELVDMVFTDPPYNVKIEGNVAMKGVNSRKEFGEFAYASGEMSRKEFTDFLEKALSNVTKYSKDGSVHYICMDWRHMLEVQTVGEKLYSELKNICVWNKGYGGMGSLYRSQHEMVFVFKYGEGEYTNNIELGKHGRNRTNIWNYAGMRKGKDGWGLHPTVKPTRMVADAIMDCSKVGDIILDIFGGSGSTLLAAEKTKRQARIIEFDEKYGDVTVYRWEKLTKKKAVLLERVSQEKINA
ncbi:MAG: site-specific DNA-methyltransferase [Brevinema sp.]